MTTYATSGYQLEVVAADGSTLELLENDWGLYRFDVLAVDATFGNAVPITEVISSLMTDGGLSTVRSWGNRIAVFQVTVKGADPGVLAQGEAALMAALDSIVALAWHAPFAAPSFFDVVACWSEFQFDDLSEVLQGERTFRVSFECLPFARSEVETTINWSGGATELDPLTSLTGWTVVSGTTPTISGGIRTTGSTVLEKSVTLAEYLWLKVTGSGGRGTITDVTVNGVSVPQPTIRSTPQVPSGPTTFFTIPTETWRGQTALVRFTLGLGPGATAATLAEFWSARYPGATTKAADIRPRGVDVIDVGGSARTPCTIRFTAPAGGAFVYTAPDPNALVRSGSGETVFSQFSVASADGAEVNVGGRLMWFPQGDHTTHIGFTDPQPTELNPDGIWPTEASGLSGADSRWSYPTDGRASISFFDTSGAKALISPRPTLPTGYSGDAVHHEVHSLYPGRSGFAVLDANGDPIAATITYYKRWKHHAAE